MPTNSRKRSSPRLRLNQSVAKEIAIAILTGRYGPGDSLGGEIEQSENMRVSRTAYREALRTLVAKGLVESRPKAGTHVTPRSRWNLLDPEVLGWMFSGHPDERFVRDLFELRGILEPAAAELAAKRRSEAQLAALRMALHEMRDFGLGTAAGQAADRQFHRLILEATSNEALISLAGSVGAAVEWTTHFKQRVSENPRDPLPEHETLFEMLQASDPEGARTATVRLLALALEDMALEAMDARAR